MVTLVTAALVIPCPDDTQCGVTFHRLLFRHSPAIGRTELNKPGECRMALHRTGATRIKLKCMIPICKQTVFVIYLDIQYSPPIGTIPTETSPFHCRRFTAAASLLIFRYIEISPFRTFTCTTESTQARQP